MPLPSLPDPTPTSLAAYTERLGSMCVLRTGILDTVIRGVTTDSREIRPGWLFCAIRGWKEDGTRYVEDALRKGAVAVVAEQALDVPDGIASLQVTDAYVAAGRLAEVAYGDPARSLRLFGITGTNGKTTCAFILREILTRAGLRTGMIGTVHHDVGNAEIPAGRTTPPPCKFQQLLRQMADGALAAAVVEVSSHALHQRRMGTAKFAAALFTNLTRDHLDYHKTFEDYFAAKRILFTDYLVENAPAVINTDDRYGKRLFELLSTGNVPVRPLAFGRGQAAEARILNRKMSFSGTRFALRTDAGRLNLETPLIGHHNIYNVAGCAALALRLGISPKVVQEAVRECSSVPGRLQRVSSRIGFAAFVDYAHTDDALRNVLQSLRGLDPERLLVVFGCGGDRDRTKRPRMGSVAAKFADRLYVTSDNPRSEDPERILDEILVGIPDHAACVRIPQRREAIIAAVGDARPGDILLVAGKGHETYQEIGTDQLPFDDVCELRNAIAQREGQAPA